MAALRPGSRFGPWPGASRCRPCTLPLPSLTSSRKTRTASAVSMTLLLRVHLRWVSPPSRSPSSERAPPRALRRAR
eukprot:2787786-Alexandrium_andersonii.AAC.1